MQEIDLLVACFNPTVAPIVKTNMEYMKNKYFGQPNFEKLLELVDEKYELIVDNGFTENVFGSELIRLGYDQGMTNLLMQSFQNMKNFTEAEIHSIKTALSNVITNEAINKCKRENITSPVDFVKALRDFNVDNIQDVDKRIYRESLFTKIDIQGLKNEIMGNALKSSLQLLNDCSPLGGYVDRTLTMVSGKPGAGKSLLMVQEACAFCKQGKKVLYLALGDMNEFHFVTRIIAQQLNVSLSRAAVSFDTIYPAIINNPEFSWLNNLLIQYFTPDQISCENWISFIKSRGYYDEYDVFIVDYDTNFSSDQEMYQKGETTYNQLKALSDRPGKWVFVGCQPKPAYFSEEILPLESGNESSRKQQIVDNMITISYPPTPGGVNHVGIINVPKYRGGMTGSTPYFMDKNGRFEPITVEMYNYLKITRDSVTLPNSGCNDVGKILDPSEVPEVTLKGGKVK